MWRNRGGQVRNRQRQGRQFNRNGQRTRDNLGRDDFRDSNLTRYVGNRQDKKDSDRNFRQDSTEYDRNQERYGRSGIEDRTERYVDDRNMYPDIHTASFDALDEFQDSAIYRDQGIDRRNIVEDFRGYDDVDNRNNDLYWEDRRPQELDDFRNRDQRLRTDDIYRNRESIDFHTDTLHRYDRNMLSDQPDVRVTEQHHERQDDFRDRGIIHHDTTVRNQTDQRTRFGWNDNTDLGRRTERHTGNWKDERISEKKPPFKRSHMKESRSGNKGKYDSRSHDRSDSGKRNGSAKRSGSRDSRDKSRKTTATTKAEVGTFKRSDSDTKQSHRSESSAKHKHKTPEQKDSNKSLTYSNKSFAKDRSDQKTADSSKNTQDKHGSDRKQNNSSSGKNREDGKKQRSSSTRAETSSFKIPGELQNQPRPRSNSGRKVDSDMAHFDNEDILSIMADDEGFEREMKTYSNTGGRSGSRNRGSRESKERKPVASRNSSRESHERQHVSREGGSREKPQLRSDRGSREKQQHGRDRDKKYDTNTKPAFDKHAKASASRSGVTRQNVYKTLQVRSQTRNLNVGRNRSYKFNNRFRPNFSQDNRHMNSRQGIKQTGRNNNNNVGGRSRFFVASKIKDSYLKRKTFQGIGNKQLGRKQTSKPFNNQSYSAKQQIHGKNEVGITGAIQEDGRIRENRLSDFRNRDRDWHDDGKKGNKLDRNLDRSLPFRKYISGDTSGSRSQRDRAKFNNKYRFSYGSFKSRGSASHRVKQKYFKGGFGQNINNSRDLRGGQKNYGWQNKAGNERWDRRSVVDKNEYAGGVHVDDPIDEQQLDEQTLDPNQQQVIFIPNTELQTGQPHMFDQYGQIVLNPEIDVQQGEDPVSLQYLPQQFHPDGIPPGEQVVFIPFVNNQVQPEYSENLPLAFDENTELHVPNQSSSLPEERMRQKAGTSESKVPAQKKKPLSKQARANLRRIIEIKRKQRIEKEIEKKLLRKLLRNPDVNKAVRESNEVKKKPVIKRISPPNLSKSSQRDKKMVRRDNNTGDLEDVSEDEAKYDNVSDLEDVSEYEDDEYESRQEKRPVFRKPGQPRIGNKNVSGSSKNVEASTSGDIRRVVDHSSRQQDKGGTIQRNNLSSRVNPIDSKQKFKQGEKSRRSVYIDNMKDSADSVTGQKRISDSSKYENKPVKKRRSISPIEITVSNDRYSNASRNSGNEHLGNKKYDSSEFDYRERNPGEGISDGRFDRTRNEKGYDYKNISYSRHQSGREKEKHSYEDKGNRGPENRDKGDREEKKYRKDRNYHSRSDAEENNRRKDLSRSFEKGESGTGKYDDYKDYKKGEEKDRNRNEMERNYIKNEDLKENNEEGCNKNEEKRGHGSDRQGGDSWRNKGDRDDKRQDRSRERMRNERKRSLSRDRSLPEDKSVVRNSLGSSRNMQGNNFVSSMNQSQFQMNQPLMQQSMQHQSFVTAQSQSIPLHGQSAMQFSNSGNTVDHSLPPVQNAPMSMPQFPPPNLGLRPDMSLPPPVMNVVGTPTSMSTMVIQQQPNSVQFQQQPIQQMGMQQQPMQQQPQPMQQQQQQQFQNMQPQFQQQQFQQMQSHPQIIQQQSNATNFQSHQPAYHNNLQSNQQMSLQQMQPGQFQQTQSGVTMMSISQNQMQNQQTGSLNQSPRGINRQGIQNSRNQQHFVAATPQQAVRGVIGRIKPNADGTKAVVRGQPVRIAASMNQVSRSPTISRRQSNTKQSGFTPSGSFESHYPEDDEVEEDDFLEMLCSKCDKVFLSHEVMRRHGRWHDMVESNTKNWRCDQCEQGFSSSSGHTEHMSVKHSRESWNCSLCDMTFSNSTGLNRHVRHASHKGLKVKFVCSLCPASFMVLMHLVQHKKDNHQSDVGYSGLRKY